MSYACTLIGVICMHELMQIVSTNWWMQSKSTKLPVKWEQSKVC